MEFNFSENGFHCDILRTNSWVLVMFLFSMMVSIAERNLVTLTLFSRSPLIFRNMGFTAISPE